MGKGGEGRRGKEGEVTRRKRGERGRGGQMVGGSRRDEEKSESRRKGGV